MKNLSILLFAAFFGTLLTGCKKSCATVEFDNKSPFKSIEITPVLDGDTLYNQTIYLNALSKTERAFIPGDYKFKARWITENGSLFKIVNISIGIGEDNHTYLPLYLY